MIIIVDSSNNDCSDQVLCVVKYYVDESNRDFG